MLIIAVVLQLTGPVAVLVFSYGWRKTSLSTSTPNHHMNFYSREPARWTIASLNQICKCLPALQYVIPYGIT